MMHRRLLLVLTSHHGTMTWMMLVVNWSVLIIVVGTLVDMLLLFLHTLLLLSLAIIEWQGRRRPTPIHGRILTDLHLPHGW